MRDLNIRGAGNLLGKQQHGFIDSVGFDLYSQMLEEAVNENVELKKKNQMHRSRNGTQLRCLFTCRIHSK